MKKMSFLLCLSALLVSACNGWNSELDTAYIEDPKGFEKMRCQFKLKENCWTRSLSLLMACVPPVESHSELFTEDLRFCSNTSGKLVEFINPLDLMGDFSQQDLQFNVYNGQKKCFRFRGNQSNFRIDQNPYGSLEVQVAANGDTQVSCLFNESFTIPAQVKQEGCYGESADVRDFLPQARLQENAGGTGDRLDFFFLGTGTASAPVFQCSL